MTNDTRRDPRLTQILQDLAHGQGMTEIEAQRAILDTMRPGRNRWAAFTNDELDGLDSILTDYLGDWDTTTWNDEATALRTELQAELERRKP